MNFKTKEQILKERLRKLERQEADFDSEEAKNFPDTLTNFRLVAEQERQIILVSNRSEQFTIKKQLDEIRIWQLKKKNKWN